MKLKKVAVVQARCGSSRLPNKMLISLHGMSLVEWVYKRLKHSKLLDDVIFAIPDDKQNEPLFVHLNLLGATVFRGSESNVLNRFTMAAKQSRADIVVRICGDNPLVSPDCIDQLIRFFQCRKLDYAYNHIPKNNLFPDGFGAEIVHFQLLERLENLVTEPAEREHIFNYIWNHESEFKIGTFNPEEERMQKPWVKLDIDTGEDLVKFMVKPLHLEMSDVEIVELFDERKSTK